MLQIVLRWCRLQASRVRRFALAATRRDPAESFYLLTRIATYLVPQYRFKRPHLTWWEDADFNAYLTRFGDRGTHNLNGERRWMVQQLMRLVVDVPGDTAECGSYKGAVSYLIARMNEATPLPRIHHAIDSFEGLSAPDPEDGKYWEIGDLTASEDELRKNLSNFMDRVMVHKGWIPAALESVERKPFAFVHIDVDLYAPTKASLEFFYPLLSPGAVVVCDDYGSTRCPGATKACDDYLADKPEKMIASASGSGFFIKDTVTQTAIHPFGVAST